MEWLLNFHMDFWIHRGRFFFLCARASTQRWIYVYLYSLLFFVHNETLNDKLENGQRRGEHNACEIM